ncbi:MAG: putative ABC transporter substrate binding protein [Chloroflexi bacterium OLB14]|nr:MAG: putative ABC transporter substrate binding protein [Chloroflexi bacterium OLB14]
MKKFFEAYQSPVLNEIAPEFILDETYHALPVDYGDVCINYDKKIFLQKII